MAIPAKRLAANVDGDFFVDASCIDCDACRQIAPSTFEVRDGYSFLFTGDHLAWSPRRGHLYAFRDACWYSWPEQIASMESMIDLRFEHVLPGHGRAAHASADEMRAQLAKCIAWMRTR